MSLYNSNGSPRRSGMIAAVVTASVLLLALLTLTATPATARATERVRNAKTGVITTRVYETHAEVIEEAANRGMSVNQFLARADLDLETFPFDCAVRNEVQTIYFRCVEKQGNLCLGRNWYIYGDTGDITFLNGTSGIDVCTYTTCKDMVCKRTDSLTAILQTVDQTLMTPDSCSCLDVATDRNTWDGMYYTEQNPNYPWDNNEFCGNVACENASFPAGGTVVYENEQCVCWYPRAIQRVIRYVFPGTLTETTREGTPDPIGSDTPGPVAPTDLPTIGPGDDNLLASNAALNLCPNAPPGLTRALFMRYINDFCCVMYFNVNYTWSACGNEVFQSMPEGWAYCRSRIPSYGFCCEVEHMHLETFVFRGDRCEVHDQGRLLNPVETPAEKKWWDIFSG